MMSIVEYLEYKIHFPLQLLLYSKTIKNQTNWYTKAH